jgi:predicted DNA-binding transcriptional regulator YafY
MAKLFSKMVCKLGQIDQLVRMKATGQPHELAERLRVSPSTIYEYIDIMKHVLAAPIRYCHFRRSYVYDHDGELLLQFKNHQLEE